MDKNVRQVYSINTQAHSLVIAFMYLVAPKGAVGSCVSAMSNTTVRPAGSG